MNLFVFALWTTSPEKLKNDARAEIVLLVQS